MAGRRLDPEEAALWRRVTDSVRPLKRVRTPVPTPVVAPVAIAVVPAEPKRKAAGRVPPQAVPIAVQKRAAPDTLDGGWDRRLRRGLASPDRTVDLHGHTLLSAHRALENELARAIADGVRVLLIITGKPPRGDDRGLDGRPKRGLIRDAMGDWLGSSRHTGRIAAVRNAHPRHGGAGALYVILRRDREA
ncbi:MAG: Smr protein/MutS2 [Rhizorhabdus sp.]|nr:Smr protein/MutS2 [Rhizorhabdus sp.]